MGGPDPRQLAHRQGLHAAQKSRAGAVVLGLLLGVLRVHTCCPGRSGVAVPQPLLTVLPAGFLAPRVRVWSVVDAVLVGSPSSAAERRSTRLR